MLEQDRVAWLATLKPGDQVAVLSRGFGLPSYCYWKIKYITPKRTRFDLEREGRESHVDKDGRWPRVSSYTPPDYIEPLTDQVRYANKVYNLKFKLEKALQITESIKLSLSADQMQRIINIINEPVPNADINVPQS